MVFLIHTETLHVYTHSYCVTPRDKKLARLSISAMCAIGHRCFIYPTAIMILPSSGHASEMECNLHAMWQRQKSCEPACRGPVVFLPEIHSCHKASSNSLVSLRQLCACSVAVRGGPVYEPRLKLNASFFVAEDRGLIETLMLIQACLVSVEVPTDLEKKSCLLAGIMHLYVYFLA